MIALDYTSLFVTLISSFSMSQFHSSCILLQLGSQSVSKLAKFKTVKKLWTRRFIRHFFFLVFLFTLRTIATEAGLLCSIFKFMFFVGNSWLIEFENVSISFRSAYRLDVVIWRLVWRQFFIEKVLIPINCQINLKILMSMTVKKKLVYSCLHRITFLPP